MTSCFLRSPDHPIAGSPDLHAFLCLSSLPMKQYPAPKFRPHRALSGEQCGSLSAPSVFLPWAHAPGPAHCGREKRMECSEGKVGGSLGFLIVQQDRLSLVLMFGHRTRSVPWATVSQRPDSRTVSPHLLTLNKLGRSIS